jgi:hypothetical protein
MKISVILSSITIALAPGLAIAGHGTEHKTGAKDKASTSLTGCLSTGSEDGAYTLKTKTQTVAVRGSEQLKEHVGHQVKLTGHWMGGEKTSQAGTQDKERASTRASGGRHFMASEIQHIAASCTSPSAQ